MNAPFSKAERLLKRYPALAPVPATERAKVVRAALLHPVCLALFALLLLWALPTYLTYLLPLVDSWNPPLALGIIAKAVLGIILPVWIISFAVSRLVMPPLLHRIMRKRGYGPK